MGQEVGGEQTPRSDWGWGGVGREPPTHQAVRLEGAALGQHGQQRLLAEKQLTDNAITAPEAAATPGPQS